MRNLLPAWILVALLSVQKITMAQTIQRDILSRFSLSDIQKELIPQNQWKPFPQTPAEWKVKVPDSVINGIILEAEKIQGTPFTSIPASTTLEYVRNGNRANYERLSFDKRNRLFTLALAESMENKGRFTEAIINGIWNICEETYWGVTAHIGNQKRGAGLPDVTDPTVDLFGAETAAVLALTDYFTGGKLDKVSPLIRERIAFEVNHKILNSFENEAARYGFFGKGRKNVKVNNWDPWITSNCMMAFLLLEKNEQRRAGLVKHSMDLLDLYINGLGEDGATDEGPSYWFAAGLALFDGLTVLAEATHHAISVFDDPIIKQLGSYIYKTHIDGKYFVNVADATPTIQADGIAIYRFGKSVRDKDMQDFGAWAYHHIQDAHPNIESFFKPRQIYDLEALSEINNAPQREIRLSEMYLPSVQLMSARTDNGFFIASHGGNNAESHNHNDVGDFIVYANGVPVIIDAGKGTYMAVTFSRKRYTLWYNTSPYHNVPLVNGIVQEAKASAMATDVRYHAGNGKVDFSMRLDKAYAPEAGLKSWLRNISVDQHGNTIRVKDAYLLSQPDRTLTQTFMTVCNTDISQPGIIVFTTAKNERVKMTYDANEWSVSRERMPLTEPHEQALKHNWNQQTIWRLLLTHTTHKISGEFTYTISK